MLDESHYRGLELQLRTAAAASHLDSAKSVLAIDARLIKLHAGGARRLA